MSQETLRITRGLCLAGALLGTIFSRSAWASGPAEASSETLEGHVVAFELGDVVVDVAGDRGATTGATLELWRPLNIKHPVTGQMVSDRFLIGRLRLVQVRGALSLALPDGKLAQPAQPGDIVVLHRPSAARVAAKPSLPDTATGSAAGTAEPPTSPALATSPAPEAPKTSLTPAEPGGGDAESAEVSAIFDLLRGASVRRRVLAYEAYVTHHPHP